MVGLWVIDTALNQISDWQNIGGSLLISVNVSAYQLQQDNFVTRMKALLASYPEVIFRIKDTGKQCLT
jgi:EAL domain-containing protein (putative c-di-GMP-specific phosphodiesterase class I)